MPITLAVLLQAALHQAQKLRDDRRIEQEKLADTKKLTWKDKVGRISQDNVKKEFSKWSVLVRE
jgi:hypothetical protein